MARLTQQGVVFPDGSELTTATGTKGDTGIQGPVGDTGIQGTKGDTGIQGPVGDTGIQGPIGITGNTGADGADGNLTGPIGPIGNPGPIGPPGIDGTPGLDGALNAVPHVDGTATVGNASGMSKIKFSETATQHGFLEAKHEDSQSGSPTAGYSFHFSSDQPTTNVVLDDGGKFIGNLQGTASGNATEAYVDTAVSNLVDSAPATLNTLNELAAALGDDANHVTTMTTLIGGKLPLTGGTLTGALTVAHNDGLTIKSHTNGAYAKLKFTDNIPSGGQNGWIQYQHSDGSIDAGSNDGFVIGGTEPHTMVRINGSLNINGTDVIGTDAKIDGGRIKGTVPNAGSLDGLDSTKFYREVSTGSGTVGPGWITVAHSDSGRHSGEVIVSDSESSDHAFIRIDWIRSYADSAFTVLNCGGHSNRITGARVLHETADNTYGWKKLQVYVSTSSNYKVQVMKTGATPGWGDHSTVNPVLQNSITGYSLHGKQVSDTASYNLAAEEGIYSGGNIKAEGQLLAVGDVIAYYSDDRLKTQIGNIESPLHKVQSLSGFIYVENELANSIGYNNPDTQVGVSAQEVKAVLPEAVTIAPFDRDDLGKSKSGEDYLTVDYAKMVPLLIEAIKELSAKVDELEKK